MSASAFQSLTLALQSNKNLLVNWLGSANFSAFFFWCNSVIKVQYSTCLPGKVHKRVFLSLVSDPEAFCWSRCKEGPLALPVGVSYCWGKEEIRTSCLSVTAPAVCLSSGISRYKNLLHSNVPHHFIFWHENILDEMKLVRSRAALSHCGFFPRVAQHKDLRAPCSMFYCLLLFPLSLNMPPLLLQVAMFSNSTRHLKRSFK